MATTSPDQEIAAREPTAKLDVEYQTSDQGISRFVNTSQGSFKTLRVPDSASADPESDWWLDFLRGGAEYPEQIRSRLGVVDLFCGSGGLSLGAATAARSIGLELEHEFAADADPQALGIYSVNHRPRFSATESVSNLVSFRISSRGGQASYSHTPQIIHEELALRKGQVDLLLAGPPCQGHSTLNNQTRFNDPRNLLYLAVPAVAVALEAPAVVIENVPGVTASKQGVVRTTVELLKSNGYNVTSHVLRSDDLGWPQTRKRFFLVATRDWAAIPLSVVVDALKREARPVSWALQDVLESNEESIMTELPTMSAVNQGRIDYLHDNDLYNLPNEQRPKCHQGGTTYTAVYGRMYWDRPAPTITTGFMTPGRGRYVHPLKRRTLAPREAARIQGFPDFYRFETASEALGRSAIAKGIGDAVPSILGFAATLSALGNRPA